MTTNLTSGSWWKAALLRALRTAVAIAIPYAGAATLFSSIPWLTIASAAALGFVLSLLTSLVGISEASGTLVPVWYSILERVVKTVAQALVAGIGSSVLFTDVHWSVILQSALIAGLGTLLASILSVLPAVAVSATPPAAAVAPSGFVPLDLAHPAVAVPKHLSGTPPAETPANAA